jgi:hypothetical protein
MQACAIMPTKRHWSFRLMKALRVVSRIALATVGVLVAVFAVIAAASIYAGKLARPISWRFPQGYRGWVVMNFQNPRCPPLVKDGLYLVIPVTASGRGCTSASFPEGWRYNRHEYVDSIGKRTRLRADGWSTNSMVWPFAVDREKNEWYLFVGTEPEFRRSGRNQPR